MKIIRNVSSSEQQEEVQVYGNKTNIYLNERTETITDEMSEDTYTQFRYDIVEVENGSEYIDVVAVAKRFFNENNKEYLLNNLIITTASGKRFYCDPASRADISDAILEAQEMGASNEFTTQWKTADGVKEVTVLELKEVRRLALEEKAKIVGVTNV